MPQNMGACCLPSTVVVRLIAPMLVDYAYKLVASFANILNACSRPFKAEEISASKAEELSKTSTSLLASEQKEQANKLKAAQVNRFLGLL